MTLWIAFLYTFFCVFIFFYTKKKYIGLFHLGLLMQLIPFVIRPILSHYNDNWTIYKSNQPNSDYWLVYGVCVLFQVFFSLGYVVRFAFEKKQESKSKDLKIEYIPKPRIGLIIIGLLFLYLFLKVGLGWLGNFRDVGASKVIAEFRYIYPLVIFIVYFCGISVYFSELYNSSKKKLYLVLFYLFIAVVLLNTRGWFIQLLMLLFCFYVSKNKLSLKVLVGLGGVLAFIAFYMRSILGWIFGSEAESVLEDETLYMVLMAKFLYTSSGDIIDVWHIVFDFVQEKGFLFGKTILSNILFVLPSDMRAYLGMTSGLDSINYYYYGDLYYEKNFGFNISFAQEMFINFGYFALIFVFINGYLYRKFESEIFMERVINTKTILSICVKIQILAFLNSLSVFSWVLFFVIISKTFLYIRSFLPKKNIIYENNRSDI